MTRVSLESLAANVLPSLSEPLRKGRDQPGLSTVSHEVDGYVWPDLLDLQEPSAAILLVRSPGAMGKSEAAKAIAHRTNAPLVDLSQVQVGSGTLSGTLVDGLADGAYPNFMADLRQGRSCLILDSIDEARFRAGYDNLVGFLANVSQMASECVPANQIVIFGRSDALELVEAALIFHRAEYQTAELAPLSRPQAADLIDSCLDNSPDDDGKSYQVHRQHSEPFGLMRDRLLLDMARALAGDGAESSDLDALWPSTEMFMGYPPVLIVLAKKLQVENPTTATTTFTFHPSSPGGDRRQLSIGEILREIIEGILDRESEKVRTRIAGVANSTIRPDQIPLLYGREEQAIRLLGAGTDAQPRFAGVESLDPAGRELYEERVQGWLADHPFLRNGSISPVVFSDYIRAFLQTSPLTEFRVVSGVEAISALPSYGPFYVHFLAALGVTEDGERPTIAAAQVDDAIKSFAMSTRSDEYLCTVICPPEGYGLLLLMEQTGETNSLLMFRIDDPYVIELKAPLQRLMMLSPGGLVISPSADRIDLGPGVDIFVGSLEMSGEVVAAQAGSPSDTVSIVALEAADMPPSIRVISHQAGVLSVSWPNLGHQWRPFQVPDGTSHAASTLAPFKVSQLQFGLRRILSSFHKGSGAEPAQSCAFLENLVVGRNPIYMVAWEALKRRSVVRIEGPMALLATGELQRFGVHHASLSSPDWVESIKPLTLAILEDEEVRDALAP